MSAGLAQDVISIEEICDRLARHHQFLAPTCLTELPDGLITPRYRFIHALYLDVLYRRVAAKAAALAGHGLELLQPPPRFPIGNIMNRRWRGFSRTHNAVG